MVAATITAQRIAEPGFLENVRATSAKFAECAGVGPVQAVRGAGLLLGLELVEGVTAKEVRDALLDAPEIDDRFDAALDALLAPEAYTGLAAAFVDRVLAGEA